MGILFAVQLESILWGFGTALGELPPYFAAYKVKIMIFRHPKPDLNFRSFNRNPIKNRKMMSTKASSASNKYRK
jgi:hypothetical protein